MFNKCNVFAHYWLIKLYEAQHRGAQHRFDMYNFLLTFAP